MVYEGGFTAADLGWESDQAGRPFPVLKGARHLEEPGQPKLPVRELLLLVPAGLDVARAWIEPLGTHRQDFAGSLAAAPPLVRATGGEMVTTRIVAERGTGI